MPSREEASAGSRRSGGRWHFAGRELDEAGARLLSGGVVHPLDHGGFGVLLCLLKHSGAVVSKDALLAAGWPGRVVSENSLTKAVGRLRQQLSDPDGELLVTAHGYGYRLAAIAERREADAPLPVPAPEAPRAPGAPSPASIPAAAPQATRVRWTVATAAVLALLVVAGWFAWPARERPAPQVVSLPALPESVSLAVLPFKDLSPAHDQGYFSDGLTDEVLDRLAKLPQLRLSSRESAFALRDSALDPAALGREIGVQDVLEGSVLVDGDRVRITVHLVNSADGFLLWSETFDRRLTELLSVQDEIALKVISALQLRVQPDEVEAVTRHRTRSPAAYQEYLSGWRLRYLHTPDNDRRAIAAYERAIALDPKFATAYAALADVLGGDAEYADSPAEVAAGKQRSLQMMDKAIELEPDRAEFYLARADFQYYTRRDWEAARRDLDTAARLYRRQPAELQEKRTRLLAVLGRFDEAIAIERAAIAENPNSSWAWAQLGYHLAITGQYAESHRALVQASKLRPDEDHVAYYDGLAWLLEGKPKDAIAAFQRSGSVFRLSGLAAAYFDAGDEAASKQVLEILISRHAPIGAYQVAQAYSWRGEADAAFEWLERAYAQNDAGLAFLRSDPMMRKLHRDPRYREWLHRLKLDDPAAYPPSVGRG